MIINDIQKKNPIIHIFLIKIKKKKIQEHRLYIFIKVLSILWSFNDIYYKEFFFL